MASEAERARLRAHYLTHREEIKARSKAYRATHKAELAEYFRGYRASHREELSVYNKRYRKINKEKTGGATCKLNNAIKLGKITRRSCEVCGEAKAEAHHDDYNFPLKVRWLCKDCHAEWHQHNKPIYYNEQEF